MNVWKNNSKQLLKKWRQPEQCQEEIIKFLEDMFSIDSIDHDCFYRVPNKCGGKDGYVNLPDGRQACLVECNDKNGYSASLYLLEIEIKGSTE